MTLGEHFEEMERRNDAQDLLPIKEQIEFLKQHKKSVFTFHMDDGRKIVRGDSESDVKEMTEFFNQYPQVGCINIEFH